MNVLAATVPVLCFLVLLRKDDPRETFLISAIVNGVFIALSTEILGMFNLLGRTPLTVCWLLYLAALVAWRYRRVTNPGPAVRKDASTPFQKLLLALLAAVAGATGITAVVAAPNNFDSLTYHLPRMMHWIQNGNVNHYPTHIERQLWMAPFSEFAMLHLQLLAGSDRFANCVQWFAMVGSAVSASLVARLLLGSVNSQVVAGVLAASLPMGVLQSTSTQNDYLVSFWLICVAYFVLKTKEATGPWNSLAVGSALALAVFTKGTAYLAAVPFMVLFLWYLAGKGWKRTVTGLLLIGGAVLLVNTPHYLRNFQLYGHPLSPGSGAGLACGRVDLSSVISGLTKNVALQLSTGHEGANRALFSLTERIHEAVGVALADPELTEGRGFSMLPPAVLTSEDCAPNPVHMSLMLLASGLLLFRWRSYRRDTVLYAAAAIVCFVVLSSGIKWNFFISRIFLCAFVLAAPAVALLFDGVKARPLVNCGAAILLVLALTLAIRNPTRPLLGPYSVLFTDRTDQYFMVNPKAKPYFTATVAMIKAQPLKNVGILNTDGNMWEYILWVLLQERGERYRIEHVEVENPSAGLRREPFAPYFPVRI